MTWIDLQDGLASLFDDGPLELPRSYSIHLWAHLWWEAGRTDFSPRCASDLTLEPLREGRSPLAELARPFLPALDLDDLRA